MSEENVILGGVLLLNGIMEIVFLEFVILKQYVLEGLLMIFYFDFDLDELIDEFVWRFE